MLYNKNTQKSQSLVTILKIKILLIKHQRKHRQLLNALVYSDFIHVYFINNS